MITIEIEDHDDVVRFGKRLHIRGESVRIPLPPQGSSEYIEIWHDDEEGELRIHHRRPDVEQGDECVYSIMLGGEDG